VRFLGGPVRGGCSKEKARSPYKPFGLAWPGCYDQGFGGIASWACLQPPNATVHFTISRFSLKAKEGEFTHGS
jgi:hypothetical protein